MRIPRSKIRAKFACNKEGSEEFAAMLEDSIESQEIMAEYEALSKGLSYQKNEQLQEERVSLSVVQLRRIQIVIS